MWIPHRSKSSRCRRQRVKWCALSFGIGNGWSFWVFWNPDKPSTLTATSRRWLSWRLEFPEWGQRRRQPFSCNMITPGPIPIWRPWSTLSILAGLSYHTQRIVRIWHTWLPTVRADERLTRGQHFPSNDAIVRAVKQWATSAGADFYERGIQALVHRWRKCIANGGDYVEK